MKITVLDCININRYGIHGVGNVNLLPVIRILAQAKGVGPYDIANEIGEHIGTVLRRKSYFRENLLEIAEIYLFDTLQNKIDKLIEKYKRDDLDVRSCHSLVGFYGQGSHSLTVIKQKKNSHESKFFRFELRKDVDYNQWHKLLSFLEE